MRIALELAAIIVNRRSYRIVTHVYGVVFVHWRHRGQVIAACKAIQLTKQPPLLGNHRLVHGTADTMLDLGQGAWGSLARFRTPRMRGPRVTCSECCLGFIINFNISVKRHR